MSIESKLRAHIEQGGFYPTPQEHQFIADLRKAAAAGVGYGWMQQVIEWEWQEKHPGSSWGPEYYEKELRAQRRSTEQP